MTINYQNLTESQESELRDKVFYLLKKYTSYTFLDQARKQYQAFLNAFARQLNDPGLVKPEPDSQRWFEANLADGTYEADYKEFLKNMIPVEEGLKLLRETPHKLEAYRSILSNRLSDAWNARRVDFRSLDFDPFYNTLGFCHYSQGESSREFLGVQIARKDLDALRRSVSEYDWWLGDGKRVRYHWSYESFFDSYDNSSQGWPPISYPSVIPSCPPKNPAPEGQIWSGEEIPTTGIWEPWFAEESLLGGIVSRLAGKQPATVTGKVGCPNYFLAGTTAFEYETDGTGDKVKVAWRLLWEDTRYLDGTIPEEESTYFEPQAPSPEQRPVVLTAMPGDPCPESGEWYSVNWEDRKALLKQGEPMPGPQYSKTGVVVWHLKKDVS